MPVSGVLFNHDLVEFCPITDNQVAKTLMKKLTIDIN